MIPYGRHCIDDKDIQAVIRALESDYLAGGPEIYQFEKKLAEYVGVKFAVAVSSGTAALHLAVKALKINEGNEGITSVNTFLASANALVYCGLKPVLADISVETRNITVESVRSCLTSRTGVVIPVHFAGNPCDVQAIRELCGDEIAIIEDAAHALGTSYPDGMKVGSCVFSQMTTFSFHPVKTITTGEGGAVTTNDECLYNRLIRLRNHGMEKSGNLNSIKGYTDGELNCWYYEQQELGFNYRMSDINAALGVTQLAKLDLFVKRRREIFDMYCELLDDVEFIRIPACSSGSAIHLYTLLIDFEKLGVSRNSCMKRLRKQGVMTQVHYIPLNLQPFYQNNFGYTDDGFPCAAEYYKSCLSIPLFPGMGDRDVVSVVRAIKNLGT